MCTGIEPLTISTHWLEKSANNVRNTKVSFDFERPVEGELERGFVG
jgi:hypothetical protein